MSLNDFPDDELLDRREEKAQSLLSNLQGNILKSHGRNFGRHLFFGVRDDVAARKYIANFSRSHVVSAAGQKEQTQRFLLTNDPKDSEMFVNVMISYKGYKAMKIPGTPKDPVFRKGMKEQHTLVGLLTIPVVDFDINIPENNPLGDPPIDKWDEPYQTDIHVAFLLADDKEEELNHFAEKTIAEAGENGLQLLHVELGRVIRNDDGNVIEHFGHPDGVSQPIFLRDDFKKWMSQQGITPDRHHPLQRNPQIAHHGNPFAPLSLVLVEDRSHDHLPHHARKEYSFGTYFVYRKLHQLVDEYHSKVQQLATLLQVSEAEADALVIGRDKRGIPLAKQKTEVSGPTVIPNNFDLDNNHHCPFHSHIRKTNPRTSEINIFNEGVPLQRSRRFARRAISYGPDPKNGPTEEDVGLLFMCANSNLAQQFVFMQSFWVNSQNFQKFHTGMDTLLGTRYAHDPPQNQKWVAEHPNRTTAFYFGDVVNMRGGEYFFLPSISTLYHLDTFS